MTDVRTNTIPVNNFFVVQIALKFSRESAVMVVKGGSSMANFEGTQVVAVLQANKTILITAVVPSEELVAAMSRAAAKYAMAMHVQESEVEEWKREGWTIQYAEGIAA